VLKCRSLICSERWHGFSCLSEGNQGARAENRQCSSVWNRRLVSSPLQEGGWGRRQTVAATPSSGRNLERGYSLNGKCCESITEDGRAMLRGKNQGRPGAPCFPCQGARRIEKQFATIPSGDLKPNPQRALLSRRESIQTIDSLFALSFHCRIMNNRLPFCMQCFAQGCREIRRSLLNLVVFIVFFLIRRIGPQIASTLV